MADTVRVRSRENDEARSERAMRVHVVNVMRGTPDIKGRTLDRFAGFQGVVNGLAK